MATYIPSAASEAIQQSSANILRAMIERAKLNEQQRQFDISQDLRERQESRIASNADKMLALNTLNFFGPLNRGKAIADLPPVANAMGTLFAGEFDPVEWQDPNGLGGMKLGDQTLDQYLNDRYIQTLESLPDEEAGQLFKWGATREVTGSPLSGSLDVQQAQINAAQQALEDPGVWEAIGRTTLGLGRQIDVEVGGNQYSFESMDHANVALSIARMMMQEQLAGQQAGQLRQEQVDKLVDDVIELGKNAGDHGIRVSRVWARGLINAIFSENPEETVPAFLEGSSDEEKAVYQAFASGASMAPAGLEIMRRTSPDFYNLMLYSEVFRDMDLTSEQKNQYLPTISRIGRERGVPSVVRNPFWSLDYLSHGRYTAGPEDNPEAYAVPGAGGGGGGGFGGEDQGDSGPLSFDEGVNLINQGAMALLNGTFPEEEWNQLDSVWQKVLTDQAEYLRQNLADTLSTGGM